MLRSTLPFLLCVSSILQHASSQTRLLDDFELLDGWKAIPSEGAKLQITGGAGKTGKAMVMEFELIGVHGYTIAQKDFPMDLPANYQFTFDMRAEAPVNNFEFKLLDVKGNVFWIKKLNIVYPKEWTKQRIKKRHLSFAWGPSGGGEIRKVQAIEFVVSSGTGGTGRVFIDNFKFEPIDDDVARTARAEFSSSLTGTGAEPAVDKNGTVFTAWQSSGAADSIWIVLDFHYLREIGGLVIDWSKEKYATSYNVELSDDGREWTRGYSVSEGNGGRDYIYLPERDARAVRIIFTKSKDGKGYAIDRLEVKGPEFSSSPNDFFFALAKDAPRGLYPKYLLKEQSNWTVIGTNSDAKESLMNEQGAIEVDKLSFSLEPFLFLDNKLVTWNDVSLKQSLLNEYLPIPLVEWTYNNWHMTVRAFSAGIAGNSMLMATYRIENRGGESPRGKLFVALRPFQVNPPWQWLNYVGGFARIDSIRNMDGLIHVNDKNVIPMTNPTAFGVSTMEKGDISDFLQRGMIPRGDSIVDREGFASAALAYDFDIHPGEAREFHIAVPFHPWHGSPAPSMGEGANLYAERALAATTRWWEEKLQPVQIQLPVSAQSIVNTVKSNLAYILINRDGPGIQPGSRSYERSWIRDGSLTSTALLQMGMRDEVREFIDWYSRYQFPSGKIPCVVDERGGDATNEHDSHGQFIYAVMTYFNYTHDTTWLRGKFDGVVKTVDFIRTLRAERKTDLYRTGTPEQRACFGLVPESISHEGYSDHPRHSYWDDFFVMKGLKDATTIAQILGEKKQAEEFALERDDFRKDLYASIRQTIKNKKIDYIPGCVELGDFDATSTTIGVNPCNELGYIPEPQLHKTFDRYYKFFSERKQHLTNWVNYTPYENRIIGTFVYLDQRERAHELMTYFMNDRRPKGWNHWAEVVWRDPTTPKFIGDMPHTWVGSDFIRSVRSMFLYEREKDDALVVGAGIPEEWVKDSVGVTVNNLPTYYGPLSYTMKKNGKRVMIDLAGDLKMPKGKIVLKSPMTAKLKSVTIDGRKARKLSTREVIVDRLPAKVEMVY